MREMRVTCVVLACQEEQEESWRQQGGSCVLHVGTASRALSPSSVFVVRRLSSLSREKYNSICMYLCSYVYADLCSEHPSKDIERHRV